MNPGEYLLRVTELDDTTFPEFRERVAQAEVAGTPTTPRSYPGYPRWALARRRPRRWASLDRALTARRCVQTLGGRPLSRPVLSRLLQFAHGITADRHRGPTPSAGGLQALELYLVQFPTTWLPAGLYHYDRLDHQLAQVAAAADRRTWQEWVPSLKPFETAACLWVLVGDGPRVAAKYGDRAPRFLLLEAGHLMQNLCLLSASLGLTTVPLGGFFERRIARAFCLPAGDVVLYVAACGAGA